MIMFIDKMLCFYTENHLIYNNVIVMLRQPKIGQEFLDFDSFSPFTLYISPHNFSKINEDIETKIKDT